MIFPKPLGKGVLFEDELRQDKKNCVKIERIGIGAKAIYLSGFLLDRAYYIPFSDIRRVYKRVAMSKGGFTGKGLFASISYLVVEYDDSSEKQFQFKFEQSVDSALEEIAVSFPCIPMHSVEAERKLRKAQETEERRYKKNLSQKAQKTISELNDIKSVLEKRPDLYNALTKTARTKRMVTCTNPFYRHLFYLLLISSVVLLLFGFYLYSEDQSFSIYFVLFSFAAILFMIAIRVRPTGKLNKKNADNDWNCAVKDMQNYLTSLSKKQKNDIHIDDSMQFAIPAQYAHPFSLERMIRIIREGRAESAYDAFAVLKKDLKAMNSSVEVSQRDYDEVVAIKPMFLCMDYK